MNSQMLETQVRAKLQASIDKLEKKQSTLKDYSWLSAVRAHVSVRTGSRLSGVPPQLYMARTALADRAPRVFEADTIDMISHTALLPLSSQLLVATVPCSQRQCVANLTDMTLKFRRTLKLRIFETLLCRFQLLAHTVSCHQCQRVAQNLTCARHAGAGAAVPRAAHPGLQLCVCVLHVRRRHVPRRGVPRAERGQPEPVRGPAAAAGGRGAPVPVNSRSRVKLSVIRVALLKCITPA